VSAFCSMFSQLLKLFPRTEFHALVKRTHPDAERRPDLNLQGIGARLPRG